jgi:hypothetical protein
VEALQDPRATSAAYSGRIGAAHLVYWLCEARMRQTPEWVLGNSSRRCDEVRAVVPKPGILNVKVGVFAFSANVVTRG